MKEGWLLRSQRPGRARGKHRANGGKCPVNGLVSAGQGEPLIPIHMGQQKTCPATQPNNVHWFSVLPKTRLSGVEIAEDGRTLVFQRSLLQASPVSTTPAAAGCKHVKCMCPHG